MLAFFGFLCVLFDPVSCDPSVFSDLAQFQHSKTRYEVEVVGKYLQDSTNLCGDFERFLVFDLPMVVGPCEDGSFLTNANMSAEIVKAVEKISSVDCGRRLLATLVAKLGLKKKALLSLKRYVCSARDLIPAQQVVALERLLRLSYCQPSHLDGVDSLEIPAIEEVLKRLTEGSGWESRAQYMLGSVVTKYMI